MQHRISYFDCYKKTGGLLHSSHSPEKEESLPSIKQLGFLTSVKTGEVRHVFVLSNVKHWQSQIL